MLSSEDFALFLSRLFSTENDRSRKGTILKVLDKTLIFDDIVYQISNVSRISALDRVDEINPLPWYFWVILVFWVLSGSVNGFRFFEEISFYVLLFVIFRSIVFPFLKFIYITSQRQRYGVYIELSSGTSTILYGADMSFIREIVVQITDVMNSEKDVNYTVNFDQRQIVDNLTGSTVVMGGMSGGNVTNRTS